MTASTGRRGSRTVIETVVDTVKAGAVAAGLVGGGDASAAIAPKTRDEMPLFRGTKELHACAMTRGDYNAYRGWSLPENENGDDPGYLVEYVGGGDANDERHEGYISWSPADVFERVYKLVGDTVEDRRENAREFTEAAVSHEQHVTNEANRAEYEAATVNLVDGFGALPENAPLTLRFANGSEFVGDAQPVARDTFAAQGEKHATYERPVEFEPSGPQATVTEAWLVAANGDAAKCIVGAGMTVGGGYSGKIPAGHLLF